MIDLGDTTERFLERIAATPSTSVKSDVEWLLAVVERLRGDLTEVVDAFGWSMQRELANKNSAAALAKTDLDLLVRYGKARVLNGGRFEFVRHPHGK